MITLVPASAMSMEFYDLPLWFWLLCRRSFFLTQGERGRDRRPQPGPDAVDRGHGLALGILQVIEIDLALAHSRRAFETGYPGIPDVDVGFNEFDEILDRRFLRLDFRDADLLVFQF